MLGDNTIGTPRTTIVVVEIVGDAKLLLDSPSESSALFDSGLAVLTVGFGVEVDVEVGVDGLPTFVTGTPGKCGGV